MMARMKSVPVRVLSLVAVCAALAGGCESDYDDLNDDLLKSGWGEDAGTRLPTCMLPTMDASSGTDSGGSTQDSSTADASSGDGGANGDSGANGDGGANGDSGTPDSGTPDAGSPDAT